MSHGAGTRRRTGSDIGKAEVLYSAVSPGSSLTEWERDGVFTPTGCRVHMIGIGGCGMRGTARVLLRAGAIVTGSDRSASGAIDQLREQGADIRIGNSAANIPQQCDLVVHSAAIDDANPELASARSRGLTVLKYSQLLGLLMTRGVGIAVAGTHGKSTTTAMVAYVLRQAQFDPSFVIGAGVEQLGGGSGVGDGEHFVVEACEYDRSFLNLRPQVATILNLELDHLDCYSGLDEIIGAFRAFADRLPEDGLLLVNGDDDNAMRAADDVSARVETFGLEGERHWRAEVLGYRQGCGRFRVLRNGQPLTEVHMALPGEYNVSNALAAMAICFRCGVEPETIARALGEFNGAHRRLTHRGEVGGVNVVDDYAHHPSEIDVTLAAAKAYYNPRRLYVVFQPHQHSRTRFLLNEFASSFGAADVVFVPDIYFVRDCESERELIDAKALVDLVANGERRQAYHEPSFDLIASRLCEMVGPGDLVITMGAGNVWQVADKLLTRLEQARGQAGRLRFMGDHAER